MKLGIAAIGLLLAVACGSTSTSGSTSPNALAGTLSVFAAASLTDAFKAEGQDFQKAHTGVTLRFNFAGTPTLVTQIEQGAQADVFASADTTNMDRLKADGLTAGSPSRFARNEL